jgi:hypothetical protein
VFFLPAGHVLIFGAQSMEYGIHSKNQRTPAQSLPNRSVTQQALLILLTPNFPITGG